MKVNLGAIEVSDDMRRAIRARYGKKGLATRAEVKNLFIDLATEGLVDVLTDWENDIEAEAEENES